MANQQTKFEDELLFPWGQLAIAAFASDNFEGLSIVRLFYVHFAEQNGVSNNPV